MASNTQYQGGGMGKKHMPPLVAKPIITVTEFTPGNTPDRVIIFATYLAFFRKFWPFKKSTYLCWLQNQSLPSQSSHQETHQIG